MFKGISLGTLFERENYLTNHCLIRRDRVSTTPPWPPPSAPFSPATSAGSVKYDFCFNSASEPFPFSGFLLQISHLCYYFMILRSQRYNSNISTSVFFTNFMRKEREKIVALIISFLTRVLILIYSNKYLRKKYWCDIFRKYISLLQASAIVVLTTSGKTAHIVAKYRPLCPILAVTRFEQVSIWSEVGLVKWSIFDNVLVKSSPLCPILAFTRFDQVICIRPGVISPDQVEPGWQKTFFQHQPTFAVFWVISDFFLFVINKDFYLLFFINNNINRNLTSISWHVPWNVQDQIYFVNKIICDEFRKKWEKKSLLCGFLWRFFGGLGFL